MRIYLVIDSIPIAKTQPRSTNDCTSTLPKARPEGTKNREITMIQKPTIHTYIFPLQTAYP